MKLPGRRFLDLAKEINAGPAVLESEACLADLGTTVLAGSPADFARLIAEETEKVGQGDPGGQHQGGVTPILSRQDIPYFASREY